MEVLLPRGQSQLRGTELSQLSTHGSVTWEVLWTTRAWARTFNDCWQEVATMKKHLRLEIKRCQGVS